MNFLKQASLSEQVITVQKGIQMILEERSLWPVGRLNLVCPTPGCPACQLIAKCKVCIKGSYCTSCIKRKTHSSKCTPKHPCDECCQRKERCQCVAKKYYPRCAGRIRKKCVNCEELPPKCTSNGKKKLFISFQKIKAKSTFRLLCKTIAFYTTRLWSTEMRNQGNDCKQWGFPPLDSLLLQVPLWTQPHWTILVSYEAESKGNVRLHPWRF